MEHTILDRPMFYRYHTDGTRLRHWVAGLASGDTVPDVNCTECERPGFAYDEGDLRMIERVIELLSPPGAWNPRHDLSAPCPREADSHSLACALGTVIREMGLRPSFWAPPMAFPAFWDLMHSVHERVDVPVGFYETLVWYNNRPGATAAEILALLEEVRERVARALRDEQGAPSGHPDSGARQKAADAGGPTPELEDATLPLRGGPRPAPSCGRAMSPISPDPPRPAVTVVRVGRPPDRGRSNGGSAPC